jgi:hypothetical protein
MGKQPLSVKKKNQTTACMTQGQIFPIKKKSKPYSHNGRTQLSSLILETEETDT